MINHQPDITKIYSCGKDSCEVKYQLFVNIHKNVGSKNYNGFGALTISYNDIYTIYKNIDEYNLNKKTHKTLIVFNDMIAYIYLIKKIIVT